MAIKGNNIVGYGLHHSVSRGTKGFVRKDPIAANPYGSGAYELAKRSTHFFSERLGRFVPKTRVVNTQEGYKVIQKEVQGSCTLKHANLNQKTLSELLLLLKEFEKLNHEGVNIDIFGYVGDENIHTLEDLSCKMETMNLFMKKIPKPLRIPFIIMNRVRLYAWRLQYQGDILGSSNILVDADSNVFFVDTVENIDVHYNSHVIKKADNLFYKFLLYRYKTQVLDAIGYAANTEILKIKTSLG